jgi:signal transduction histidine kinase
MNNAIKHSEGNITINIKVDETIHNGKMFYDVSIADNGPGIPDTLKPKLFSRFTRGETKAHGRGLGLFIVKSLVEHAGGDVTATDRVPGNPSQGARFIVSLPACEVCR